jgi:Holliday junction DNA helicase RuvA
MISHLDGRVSAIAPEGAVIEVGGVGLLVQCTPGTLATLRPGERARVATSLVVREDALTLFGFAADDERDVFELLQTASGVGPRLALAMLAVFTPDALRRAVAAEDVTALTRVPGIGRKGAQRIVLELAGRLGPPGVAAGQARQGQLAAGPTLPGAEPWRDQIPTRLPTWAGRRARRTRRSRRWRPTCRPRAAPAARTAATPRGAARTVTAASMATAALRTARGARWTSRPCCGRHCGN